MALLANNLYILDISMSLTSEIKTRLLFRNASHSKLGKISRTGVVLNRREAPKQNMRVLGSYAIVYLLDGSGFFKDAHGFSSSVT
jgi:hypothetical protein